MAKNDTDLFERLRGAGLRKQVARTLSEIGEGASKKAIRAARSAIGELRSLADELERRLPGKRPGRRSSRAASASRSTGARSRTTTTRSASRGAAPSSSRATRAGSSRSARGRSGAGARTQRTPAATGKGRAPRGANKAQILQSLQGGPKTASQVAKETGIGTGTVGSTLSKLLTAGEVVKADRGYALPASS